jgi:serine/threonine protein kinase
MATRIGNYEIGESFFESGPSTFFQAKNLILGNEVIARRLSIDPARAQDVRETFFREMRHAAGLPHPGIGRPLDVMEAEGHLWAIQEKRLGDTTEKRVLESGPVPLLDAARWGSEIADVLAYLHGRGFVYGRTSPRWILVDERGAVLVALTKSADLAAGIWPLRPAVAALGPFSAPEELRGGKPTAQSDVYGLAATIQWWLTREWPRGGRDPEEAVRRVKEAAPAIPLRKLRPDVPAGLVTALEGALELDPEMRVGSAASLGRLLDEVYHRLLAEAPSGFVPGAMLRPDGCSGVIVIDQRHGSGAYGVVFRAREAGEGTVLAVKALKSEHREDAAVRERFLREARALQGIVHENVVGMRGVGEQSGTPYCVMEFVDGPDLATLILREGALPATRAVRIAAGIARGLAAIHAEGVVHRDLKPHNVLIAAGDRAVIADFGTARSRVSPRMTATGMLLGTPAYMAPEQFDGLAPSFSVDLFALGAILFEMSAGRPAFPGGDAVEVIRSITTGEIPVLASDVPSSERDLARRLMARDPAQRPSSAAAAARWLEAIAGGLGPADASKDALVAAP